jgi:hypothetical protein
MRKLPGQTRDKQPRTGRSERCSRRGSLGTYTSSRQQARTGGRPKFPWLLLSLTVVFAVLGWPLAASLLHSGEPAPAAGPVTAGSAAGSAGPGSSPAPGSAATAPSPGARQEAPGASPSPVRGELPPRGEGPAGDEAVQRVLESAWPADVLSDQASRLVAEGRQVLLADLTGLGQDRYPTAFPDAAPAGAAVAPAFTRIRIQAAIARKDTVPGRLVVHLVWAGADRGGSYTDGRITDIRFTHPTKDSAAWTPQPPSTS